MKYLMALLATTTLSLLAACSSSPPVHYYTLLAMPGTARAHTPANFQLNVLPITLTPAADRPQLMVRKSPDEVLLLEGHQWVAPLPDEIRTLLSSALTQQLGARDIHVLGSQSDLPVYRVSVDISRFAALPGDHTQLTASWRLQPEGNAVGAVACSSQIQKPVGNQIRDVVAAQREGLLSLASEIGETLEALVKNGEATCSGE